MERVFSNPVIELARVLGDDSGVGVLDLADVTDDEAEIVLAVLAETEAEEQAAGIVATLKRQGHAL